MKLAAGQRHQEHLHPGQYLAYRRPPTGGPGSWYVRWYISETRKDGQQRIGTADDSENPIVNANINDLLNYEEAKIKAIEYIKTKTPHSIDRSQIKEEPALEEKYTVAECLADYFDWCKSRGKNKGPAAKTASDAHIIPSLGARPIIDLTREELTIWIEKLAASSKRKRKKNGAVEIQHAKAPATEEELRARAVSANRVATTLKAALNYAMSRGKINTNKAWYDLHHSSGVDKNRERHLSVDEQRKLIKACPKDLGQLVSGALFTGARFGELSQLTIDDFHHNDSQIYISPLIDKNKKGEESRLIKRGCPIFQGNLQRAQGK